MEREVEPVRAFVEYSRYNKTTGCWVNQSFWCNCDEIRSLAELLDKFLNGDGPSDKDGFPGP